MRPDFSNVETDIKKKKNEKNDKLVEVAAFHKNKLKENDKEEEWVELLLNTDSNATKLLEAENDVEAENILSKEQYTALILDQVRQEKLTLEKAQSQGILFEEPESNLPVSVEGKCLEVLRKQKVVGFSTLISLCGKHLNLGAKAILSKVDHLINVLPNGNIILADGIDEETGLDKETRKVLINAMLTSKTGLRKTDLVEMTEVSVDKINLFLKDYCRGLLSKWQLIGTDNDNSELINCYSEYFEQKSTIWGIKRKQESKDFSKLLGKIKQSVEVTDCIDKETLKELFVREGGKIVGSFNEFVAVEFIEVETGYFFKNIGSEEKNELHKELIEMLNFKGKMSQSMIRKNLTREVTEEELTIMLKNVAVLSKKSWTLKESNK